MEDRRNPAIIHRIETHLHRLDRARTKPRKPRPAAVEMVDLTTPYLERLKQLVNLDQIRASGQRFVIDPMYGAGSGCVARLVQRGGNSLPGNSRGAQSHLPRAESGAH